ncbi:CD99 antigen [Saccopteryx leptura]|uniref:CD99 antigen n=1 Tax=Saccopteryx leptura TaxID=249018 RepID=UPI00339C6BDE
MARSAVFALLLVGLLGSLVSGDVNDFDLSDALDDVKPTSKKPSTPSDDGGFSLDDALNDQGHGDPGPPKPKPNPDPRQPGSSGGFSDDDLAHGTSGGAGGHGGEGEGGGSPRHDGEGQADSPGVVPGIVGAVVVAVAGAISSFIAYQKKKLCFKENTDQADINMENHRNTNAEPPVQQTLIEK